MSMGKAPPRAVSLPKLERKVSQGLILSHGEIRMMRQGAVRQTVPKSVALGWPPHFLTPNSAPAVHPHAVAPPARRPGRHPTPSTRV